MAEPLRRRGRPPKGSSPPALPADDAHLLDIELHELEDVFGPVQSAHRDVLDRLNRAAATEYDGRLIRPTGPELETHAREAASVEPRGAKRERRLLPMLPAPRGPSALERLVAEELPPPETAPRPPAEPRAIELPSFERLAEGTTDQRDKHRSRRKHGTRARTISVKRMTKRDLEIGRIMYPPLDVERPITRADCARFCRPCPFVSCRWHLYLDVSPSTGAIKLNFPDLEVDELEYSCALDVADVGGATLEQVGYIANITRERVRQIEVVAFRKLDVDGLRRHADDEHRVPVRAVAV